ncbi:MAG: guanine nucleotide exchange protein for ADP-robosylation factor, partial [Tremellales sp. Tagirdzhanova-0007]
KSDIRFRSPEDLSVWLSTTLISALRDTIDLFAFHFEVLQTYLDGLLDILVACICQENDTLARIGTSCLQQLLESNVRKLSPEKWELIVSAFVQLFKTTTAGQLFDPTLHTEVEPTGNVDEDAPFQKFVAPAPLELVHTSTTSLPHTLTYAEQRRIFKQIIVKCVLQLLLIETTHELLQNDDVYNTIPAEHLLRFMGVLDDSWRFARIFNADKDLRMRLWKLPNLLKQESSSAATLINVLLRMYRDPREAHRATRNGVLDRLVPLGTEVIKDFIAIDPDTQPRNVTAWTPVVTDILQGCINFEEAAFEKYIPTFYPLITDILSKEVAVEMRLAESTIRRGHPVIMGLLCFFAVIEGCITAWLVTEYNKGKSEYPNHSYRDRLRFLVFVSWWTVVFTALYLVFFLINAGSFIVSIASHGIWFALTWFFWLVAIATYTAALGGGKRCNEDHITYCSQLVAAEAFGWIEWIIFSVAFILIFLIGGTAMRRGEGLSGALV